MSKRLSILGSTGSIGENTLKVCHNLGDEIEIVYLTANKNADKLIEQINVFHPKAVVIVEDSLGKYVKQNVSKSIDVLVGRKGLLEIAGRNDVDIVMNGLVGSAGMEPTIRSLDAGVNVALSNKESLVMAGSVIESIKVKTGAKIFPVDSEHSAIWQCLTGEDLSDVRRIILTGSGGPFRLRDVNTFSEITPKEALNHPNWDMGNKITIDSATMMNKGLEVIEAKWLFGLKANQIEIVVHPQSIIHSMVEFSDGSIKAQLGVPDMKIPIQYSLTYPRHVEAGWETLDLVKINNLTFEAPDLDKFPCIKLAYDAMESGGSTPAVLNVANEQAVYKFLEGRIQFTDIPKIIEKACAVHNWVAEPTLNEILDLELWATDFVNEFN
ncbi:MAG: 1-deoxy-D-xylulose-5-phosphate reductoisomerase [Candidatus Marinimicrobia bacterium]|nr:1-deoxy-D-xylulose-5-phosphate reductoisomerase [Candidatus Neomarinimicrobiota bacterium]